MDYLALLASMNVTQFRAFKKALGILSRMGIESNTAIFMMLDAHQRYNAYSKERRAS
jgi:hypothetical protein